MNEMIIRALVFSEAKHRHQKRKDTAQSPYIKHPIEVFSILALEAGITDTDVLCAALLHDTIEDTDTTAEEIEQHFGKDILAIVLELTDDKSLPKEMRKELQIRNAAKKSGKAKLIKMADKIANLRDMHIEPPTGWPVERVNIYFQWSQHVVKELGAVHPQLDMLFSQEIARHSP